MSEIQYKQIDNPDDKVIEQVSVLFSDMYDYMQQNGLVISLEADGAGKWINSVKRTLNRFSTLQIAQIENEVIGFAHGALSMTPDFLGNKKVGVVTHIFVKPAHRKQNIAAQLLSGLEKWFELQQVHSIELQVLAGNAGAIEFWQQMGYENELFQFRKMNT